MTLPPASPDLPLPDEVVDAFAAGELAPADAERVLRRAARDPALAARIAGAARVEAALRAQEPAPLPLGLVAATLARIDVAEAAAAAGVSSGAGAAPRRAWGRAAAVAAALALVLGAWRAGGLDLPAGAPRLAVPAVGTAIAWRGPASLPAASWASLPSGPGAGPLALVATVAGVALCVRTARRRASAGEGLPCAR